MKIKVTDLFTHFKKDAGHGRIHQAIMDRETGVECLFSKHNYRVKATFHRASQYVWFSLQLNHSPARGLYELNMGWWLRRASRPQPERGYCDGGR